MTRKIVIGQNDARFLGFLLLYDFGNRVVELPRLILGDRQSAALVLELLRSFLIENADSIRARIPYWDDLVAYQGAFFLSDALPPNHAATPFPAAPEPGRGGFSTV